MKVYKVVEKFGGKLHSAITALHARPWLEEDTKWKDWRKWSVTYRKNKVAYPKVKGSFLFSFRRFKDAKDFVFYNNHQRELAVFKAETVGKIREFPMIATVSVDNISAFWKTVTLFKCSSQDPPNGTIGAEGIKLIEEKVCRISTKPK